jgi:hypothetical protein
MTAKMAADVEFTLDEIMEMVGELVGKGIVLYDKELRTYIDKPLRDLADRSRRHAEVFDARLRALEDAAGIAAPTLDMPLIAIRSEQQMPKQKAVGVGDIVVSGGSRFEYLGGRKYRRVGDSS